jgi:hypothetical protein
MSQSAHDDLRGIEYRESRAEYSVAWSVLNDPRNEIPRNHPRHSTLSKFIGARFEALESYGMRQLWLHTIWRSVAHGIGPAGNDHAGTRDPQALRRMTVREGLAATQRCRDDAEGDQWR